MRDRPLWQPFILWGAIGFVVGALIYGGTVSSFDPNVGLLIVGLLMFSLGGMVLLAGLIGAAVSGTVADLAVAAPASRGPVTGRPVGVSSLAHYLRDHPHSRVEEIAAATGATPSETYVQLDELRQAGRATVDSRARWSVT